MFLVQNAASFVNMGSYCWFVRKAQIFHLKLAKPQQIVIITLTPSQRVFDFDRVWKDIVSNQVQKRSSSESMSRPPISDPIISMKKYSICPK
jgi:hypothetical protein